VKKSLKKRNGPHRLLISQIFFHEICISGKVENINLTATRCSCLLKGFCKSGRPSPLLAARKMFAAMKMSALDLKNPQLCFPLVSATVNPPLVLPDEAAPFMPCSHAAVWNKQVRIWVRHSKSIMRYPDFYVK